MKKSTKGALAAVAAGVLLLGGAGTLAYWNATGTVSGVNVQAGELKIVNDTCATANWVFDNGEEEAGKTYVPGTDLIVPGDTLTKECSFQIRATGEHLHATLTVTNPALSGDLASNLTLNDSFAIGGTPVANGEITEQNNNDTVDASISVTFNTSAGNPTQTQTGALSDFSVALQQIHN